MLRRLSAVLILVLAMSACTAAGQDRDSNLTASTTPVPSGDVTATDNPAPTATSPTTTLTTAPPGTSTTAPSPPTTAPNENEDSETATVVAVTDGDTVRVLLNRVEEPVRLIGINAPEGGECVADQATARLDQLLDGTTVSLVGDQSDRDQFDRLLRYLYLDGVFINELLVREGLALAVRYQPDTAQAATLEAAQTEAEADQVGMWAPDACGATSEATITIGTIHYDADGDDSANLNDEWVEFTNTGASDVDLTGWQVKDESASHRYEFPTEFTLAAGATVRLHTGCGTDTAVALYWCKTGTAVWNNSGDTVFVLDQVGNIVASKGY